MPPVPSSLGSNPPDWFAWALCDDFFALLAKELGVKSLPDKRCADRGEEWDRTHPGCKYRTPKRTAASAM